METETGDMIERCIAAKLAEPEFRVSDGFFTVIYRKPAQAALTGEVGRILVSIQAKIDVLRAP